MTLNTLPRMDVVKREDKEAKLKAFISAYLETRNPQHAVEPWLLIARSAESPVVLALASLAPEIAAAGITLKTLIAHCAPALPDSVAPPTLGFASDLRVSRDVRLLDAHEQLRLDAAHAWVGDCMRREPAKRDAYECYANGCTVTADWSAKSFAHLWSRGEPTMNMVAAAAAPVAAEPSIDACVAQANQIPSTVVASTRH